LTKSKGESANAKPEAETLSPPQVHRIIAEGDAGALVEFAQRIGRKLAEVGLGVRSLRSLLADMHVIELTWPVTAEHAQRQILLLKPKIMYLSKRDMTLPDTQKSPVIEELWQTVSSAVDIVMACPDESRFGEYGKTTESERQMAFVRLIHFLEAILAYHRYHSSTD